VETLTIDADGRFDVPVHARSVLISATGDPAGIYTTRALTSPAGELVLADWYDDATVPICLSCPNRVANERGGHAVMAPSSPSAEAVFTPGAWTYEAHGYDGAAAADVSAVVKIGDPDDLATGALTVALHLTGAGGLTAESAPTDQVLQQALLDFGQLYHSVGISLEFTYHDVPEEGQAVTVETRRSALFAHRKGSLEAIAVYVVDTLTDDAGTVLLALSPLPGPYGEPAADAGIILRATAPSLGRTLAHEVGHYLGLWHTFEAAPADKIKDPLPDTAPPHETDNLMAPGKPGDLLTEGQGAVMRRHPMVRHLCD